MWGIGKSAANGEASARFNTDLRLTNRALVPFLGVSALIVIVRYAFDSLSSLSIALMWAASCLILGAAIGFLFSIPKVVQEPQSAEAEEEEAAEAESISSTETSQVSSSRLKHQVNSNLVEISDWLTKIIVGLGLVNLEEIPRQLNVTAQTLARGLAQKEACGAGTACADYPFALALIVAFSVLGFLMGYLYTRLFLAGAFVRADNAQMLRADITRILEQQGVSPTDSSMKVTPAQLEAAERVRDLPVAQNKATTIAELNRLASEYDRVRMTMISGASRTQRMSMIVTRMRALALAGYEELKAFTESASPGKRLAAVSMLQVKPNADYWGWLLERLSLEKPFIAYHAIEALRRAAQEARGDEREALTTLLTEWAHSERGKALLRSESDRSALFKRVIEELKR